MERYTLKATLFAVALGLLGTACGGGGAADDPVVDPDGGVSDSCEAGTQDTNGDGVCQPDCSQTACANGTCAVDSGSGLAECSCDTAFQGDACDELIVPGAAGVAFWVDAADAATITTHSGISTVASWSDKGPATYIGTTESTDLAPTLVPNSQNGLPAVHFSDDHVSFLNFSGVKDTEYTMFLVMRSAVEGGTVLTGTGQNDSLEVDAGANSLFYYHEPSGAASNAELNTEMYGGKAWSTEEFHLVTMRMRSSEVSIWIDGNYMNAAETPGPQKISEVVTLTLGGRENGGNGMVGDIAEFIVVPDSLHYGERKPYEDYLAAKWFGAAFERTPTTFGETMIWLDAANNESVQVVGDSVLSWANGGVGQGFFANGTFAEARPQLVANALGGLPVIRFDGGDALGQNDVVISTAGQAGQYSIIAVVVPPTSGSAQRLFQGDRAQNDARALQLDLEGGAGTLDFLHRWPFVDSIAETSNLAGIDYAKPMIIKVERSPESNYALLAGDATSSMNLNTGVNNYTNGDRLNCMLGGESISVPGAGFNGDIAEFIVLGNTLENAEETALMDHLEAKWGIE